MTVLMYYCPSCIGSLRKSNFWGTVKINSAGLINTIHIALDLIKIASMINVVGKNSGVFTFLPFYRDRHE